MPKRIQLSRKKGWRKPKNTVVVSRPSKFGNPFSWKNYTQLSGEQRKYAAMRDFENWLGGQPDIILFSEKRRWILDHLEELRGKNLACWCKPGEPCHADVLLELANS